MWAVKTYYEILEIAESAKPEEVRAAYLRLAKEYHPDRVPKHLTKLKRDAEEKFKEIQEAWAVLGDPTKRNQFDKRLRERREQLRPQTPSPHPSPTYTSPPSPLPSTSSTAYSYFFMFLFVACVALIIWTIRAREHGSSSTAPTNGAPEQIIDRGAAHNRNNKSTKADPGTATSIRTSTGVWVVHGAVIDPPNAAKNPNNTEPEVFGVFGVATENGFQITSVQPVSPAQQIFLNPGDLITKINGRDVYNSDEIQSAIAASTGARVA